MQTHLSLSFFACDTVRTIHSGLHVNLPIAARNTPGTVLIIIPRVRRN
jgi:hypothetical protein